MVYYPYQKNLARSCQGLSQDVCHIHAKSNAKFMPENGTRILQVLKHETWQDYAMVHASIMHFIPKIKT